MYRRNPNVYIVIVQGGLKMPPSFCCGFFFFMTRNEEIGQQRLPSIGSPEAAVFEQASRRACCPIAAGKPQLATCLLREVGSEDHRKLTVVISASLAFCSLNSVLTTGWAGPAGTTSVLSYTTTRRSRISVLESKKARRLLSFHVDVVVAEVDVVIESWLR